MQERNPVKAWEHSNEEFPNNREYKAVVYPETMRVLCNISANADANVIYLYFNRVGYKPIRATIDEKFSAAPICGRHCATCKHYSPHFSESGYDGYIHSMRQLNEGRCNRVRVPGKRAKGVDTCEHWEGKNK